MKFRYGKYNIFLILLVIMLYSVKISSAYTVPTGIPDPSPYFDGFDPINAPAPTVGSDGSCDKCPNWPLSESPGCYFIDKTNPNATDSDNPYGYPNKPRQIPPEGVLNLGDFLYFNVGLYTADDSKGDRFDWSGQGTASNPIWICGNPNNIPIIQDFVQIGAKGSTSYVILDSLEFSGSVRTGISIAADSDNTEVDHIVIRNCRIQGTKNTKNTEGVKIGYSKASFVGRTVNYTVIYNCHISDMGEKDASDECGVYLGLFMQYTWALYCDIYDCAADSIGGSHYADRETAYAKNYYIGDNQPYNNGEDGIDLKAIENYIISHNTIHSFNSGPLWGAGIVLHYGAESIGCKNGWIMFNTIYECKVGIAATDVDGYTRIIGNVLYDIRAKSGDSSSINGVAIGFRGMKVQIIIADNTIYDFDHNEIVSNQDSFDPGDLVLIQENIISNRRSSGRYEIRIDGGEDHITIKNNHYYGGGNVAFYWEGSSRDLNDMKSIGQYQGEMEGDPRFVNLPTDFSLQSSLPAIDAGVESDVYDLFYSLYGLRINKDKAGTLRPQGSAWDIGAYEYVLDTYADEDVNQDGQVNISDVQLVVNVILGNATNSRADVNGDGSINIQDVQAVVNEIVE